MPRDERRRQQRRQDVDHHDRVDRARVPRHQQAVDALPRLGDEQRGEAARHVVEHEAERMRPEAAHELFAGIDRVAESTPMAADARG